jgi:putative transposase
MPNYRRAYVSGGMFFFTLVTEQRAPILTDPDARRLLRRALVDCRSRWPFRIEAIVLLPDHLHTIWSLPQGDAQYSLRWAWIKREFTKSWVAEGGTEKAVSDSRHRNQRRGVWQRRFWEHYIRDEMEPRRYALGTAGRQMMATSFYCEATFVIPCRLSFVLAGQVIDGTVRPGMRVSIPLTDGEVFSRPIHSVGLISTTDKKGRVGLSLQCDTRGEIESLQRLEVQDVMCCIE